MDPDQPLSSLYLNPEQPYRGGALLSNLILFGRICRGLGMQISATRLTNAALGLSYIDLYRKHDFRSVLQACLVTRPEEISRFHEAFRLFWSVPGRGADLRDLKSLGEERLEHRQKWLSSGDSESQEAADPTPIQVPVYSRSESLRQKAFSEMDDREMAEALEMIRRLSAHLPLRRSRRSMPGPGRKPDFRRILRASLQWGGEPLALLTRHRKRVRRPLVLICDISGSMERYTRVLMHFAHTLSSYLNRVESFVFATRLTRITRALRRKSIDVALREAGMLVEDWASGTDTGGALRRFNTGWGRRVLGHGAIVLLITDGWDRGDPELLGREMAHLHRASRRLIWLNPLLGETQFEPRTRGALAMLPHVDDFLSVRNLASLECLIETLESLQSNRRSSGSEWRSQYPEPLLSGERQD